MAVHGNKDGEASRTTRNAKKRSLHKIVFTFPKKKNRNKNGKPSISGELTPHNFCHIFLNMFSLNYLSNL